jgi:AraC-like DNA-binding protein
LIAGLVPIFSLQNLCQLADQRIRKAQELPAQADFAIAEIALQVGYSDQSALTKVMRRVTGHTPAVYRRRQRD